MNKNTFIIILATFALGFTACEDELDQAPISASGSNEFYRNADEFEQAVNGIYNSLASYPARQFDLFEVRSDNVYAAGSAGVRDYNAINNFSVTATVSFMETAWNDNFAGIMRANTVLDKITAEIIDDPALYDQFVGEAKFLRAFFYFDLVRIFGKVPVIDKFVSPTEALEIGRSPVAEVYDLILADLQDAIELLPPSYTDAGNTGRATSWAAKALLARVYLTRSGPTYDIEGPGLNTDEYADALALLNDIIANGPYGWVNDYAAIFAYDNENNADIVFDIQFIGGGVGAGSDYVSLMYSEPFARGVGIPYAGGTPPDGPKTPSSDLFTSYENNDARVPATFTESYLDETADPPTVVDELFFSKYLDLDEAINANQDRFDFALNYPVIRYTDVLMMKGEALLQTGGNQGEVDGIVNDVRERAQLTPVANVTYEQLIEERRREFAGEGLRWHDLVRSGLVIETMNAWLATEDPLNKMPETINTNQILYPIHQNQLDVKPGLYKQNPGY